MSITTYLVLVVAGVWVARNLLTKWKGMRDRGAHPPGPPPRMLIGNLLDFPTPGADAAQQYIDWGRKYSSDILFASALGNHILVLNKREDVEELLEKRSAIYSDRPSIPIVPMLGWKYNVGLMSYGEEWRVHRKVCQQNFRQEAAPLYNPVQIKKVNRLLRGLLYSPEKLEDHIKMFSVSIPMSTMYGYEVQTLDDPAIQAADKSVVLGAVVLSPGGSLINVFPFLKHVPAWFPGAVSHRIADEVKRLTEEMAQKPLDALTEQMVQGTASPSLVANFLERKESVGATEEEEFVIKNVAFTVYAAASDTTISSAGSLFYALARHPEVQKKGKEEISRVVGSSRLPDFGDRHSLPYVEAVYRELMRWLPPLPIGVPHRLSEDDFYKGYLIPKGTSVFANIWAMSYDETVYPEPHLFKPERHLTDDGELSDDDSIIAYGFGRRVCVGKHVASSTMWLLLANVLATFEISTAKDHLGHDIEINDDYELFGLIRHKKHYQCSISCRSSAARLLITGEQDD